MEAESKLMKLPKHLLKTIITYFDATSYVNFNQVSKKCHELGANLIDHEMIYIYKFTSKF